MAIDTALKQDIVSQSVLEAFRDYLTPWNVFARDYGGEISSGGDTVDVPLSNAGTAAAFAGDYTTNADNDVGAVTVTVDQHVYKTRKMTDIENANNQFSLEQMGTQLGIALGKAFSDNILALVTAANYGSAAFTGAAAGFDSDDVIDIKTACTQALMPIGTRGLVLDSAYYDALLKDASIKNADKYGTNSGVQGGMIQGLSGFTVYENTAIPANAENLVGFAASPDGMALALRYLVPDDEGSQYIEAMPIQDEASGVVIGMRKWYDPAKGTKYLTYEANFGRAVAQAAGLKRLVSA